MPKFEISFKLFGNVEIEAGSLAEAINKFEHMPGDDLAEYVDQEPVMIGYASLDRHDTSDRFSRIKGYSELNEAQRKLVRMNHTKLECSRVLAEREIVKMWVDEEGVVCVKYKMGYSYRFYSDGSWS